MRLDWTADRVVRLLSREQRDAFAADPLTALQGMGFQVTAVATMSSSRDDGGFCDGVSFMEDGVILYAPTPSSRRENFTLAHELAHHLVMQELTVLNWVANQSSPEVVLESVCDRVAQRLLLPADTIAPLVKAGPIRAQTVVDLFEASNASWQACAIALAGHLTGLGAVVLIDRFNSEVAHASVNPDPNEGWPLVFPWRGQTLSEWHPLMKLGAGETLTAQIPWKTRKRSHDFFANATSDERRIIAVLSDVDMWTGDRRRLDIPREFDNRPKLRIFCCGQERWVSGYPCSVCREQFCPVCKGCRCTRTSKRAAQCSGCFMEVAPQLLDDGLCENCR